jgi:hypothetical protein
MFDPQEPTRVLMDGVAAPFEDVPTEQDSPPTESIESTAPPEAETTRTENEPPDEVKGAASAEARDQHADAGRKGAHRVHQLIREGKLYEQEHGLKKGRQRLRQLIELGKLYEQEHGFRPNPKTSRRERLSRTDREDILTTLLQCLVRLAKPSFRAELLAMTKRLQDDQNDHAA